MSVDVRFHRQRERAGTTRCHLSRWSDQLNLWSMSSSAQRDGDIALAVSGIAAELGLEVRAMPESITGILRAFSTAHYNAGVRDTLVRVTNQRALLKNEPIPSSLDVTPVVGPHGRRARSKRPPADTAPLSKRPTPLVPPPHGVVEDDKPKRKR